MKTQQEVADALLADLRALLAKYDATLTAEDHYPGWPECGEDVRMTVSIPAVYSNDGSEARERIEIDLGSSFKP